MTNTIYIAVSLDGFIADTDGGLDWLTSIPNPDQNDYGFSYFMDSIDAVVMGRNTFETILTLGEWIYTKPVFVFSHFCKVPEHLKNKVEIVRGDIGEVVKKINLKGFENLYVDGGKTVQAFLKLDLIDEMIITTVSTILGDGIPLFGKIGVKRNFKLTKTEMLNAHIVKQYYKRA